LRAERRSRRLTASAPGMRLIAPSDRDPSENISGRKCYAVYGHPSYSLAAVERAIEDRADHAIRGQIVRKRPPGAEQLPRFYRWTVDHPENLVDVWDFCGASRRAGARACWWTATRCRGRRWSPEARLNFAET